MKLTDIPDQSYLSYDPETSSYNDNRTGESVDTGSTEDFTNWSDAQQAKAWSINLGRPVSLQEYQQNKQQFLAKGTQMGNTATGGLFGSGGLVDKMYGGDSPLMGIASFGAMGLGAGALAGAGEAGAGAAAGGDFFGPGADTLATSGGSGAAAGGGAAGGAGSGDFLNFDDWGNGLFNSSATSGVGPSAGSSLGGLDTAASWGQSAASGNVPFSTQAQGLMKSLFGGGGAAGGGGAGGGGSLSGNLISQLFGVSPTAGNMLGQGAGALANYFINSNAADKYNSLATNAANRGDATLQPARAGSQAALSDLLTHPENYFNTPAIQAMMSQIGKQGQANFAKSGNLGNVADQVGSQTAATLAGQYNPMMQNLMVGSGLNQGPGYSGNIFGQIGSQGIQAGQEAFRGFGQNLFGNPSNGLGTSTNSNQSPFGNITFQI